jgi:hypothetical protein
MRKRFPNFAFNFDLRLYSKGGLSEVPKVDYLDALYANTIAAELGMYGVKPEVLHDIMAGKRQGLALVHVRAQLQQIRNKFVSYVGYTVDRRAQAELKRERV